MNTDEIAKLLEEIASTAKRWSGIGDGLRKQGLDGPDHILWKYVFAFEYMQVEESNGDYFDRYGPFAPFIETQDGVVFPPPLNTLGEGFLEEWGDVLEHVQNPILCSRLSDLLWVRKWGKRPDLFARQAIDSYFEVSHGTWIDLDRARCLIRALSLCKEINDGERTAKIISAIINSCYEELNSESPKPGVSQRLIEALMKLPKGEIPNEVDKMLYLSLHVYEENTWIEESILTLMMKRSDEKRVQELQHDQVNRWVEEAEESEKGLNLVYYLQHALELARNYGFQEIAEEIRRRIQSIPEEDFGLQTVSAEVQIPKERIEDFLNWFIDEKSRPESFIRFGYYGPPSGDNKKNIEDIEKQFQESPLLFLVTRAVYDEFNVPIRYGRDIDENKDIAVVNQETMGIRFFGTFAPEILNRIREKFGPPTTEELTELFITPIITSDISENIAKAIDWYYKGEFDVSAHILIPRIEAIIRILARELRLSIIREPVGAIPGGVVQLGNLLTKLQGHTDESWRQYLYNVLVNPIGVNLRNRICHGLIPKVEKEDAALLIHVACYLRLMRISKPERPTEPE